MSNWKQLFLSLVGAMIASVSMPNVGQAIVTVNDPSNHLVAPGNFSGVVSINDNGSQFCGGSLLTGGLHVLTAAHCLFEESTGQFKSYLKGRATVGFYLQEGFITKPVSEFFVHPNWQRSGFKADIAVLKLGEAAPANATQYDIYRSSDEIGQVFTKVGYGYTGTGSTGAVTASNASPNRPYFAQNRFDSFGDVLARIPSFAGVVPGSQLLFDFDSGKPENDAFGMYLGINDLGLGSNEGNTAVYDSGGPAFIGNSVAGITSYGLSGYEISSNGLSADPDRVTNSTFGEISGETRVSHYASFVDGVRSGMLSPQAAFQPTINASFADGVRSSDISSEPVPEPATVLGAIAFGGWGASWLRKRKKRRYDKI